MFGKKGHSMSIRTSIRKNIEILKEEKKVRLTEEKIISARLSLVPTQINENSTIQVNRGFNLLFTELRSLKSLGLNQSLINENLISILGQMFDGEEGSKFTDKIKQKLAQYLQGKFQLTETEEEILEDAIGNTEIDDVPELFNDPRFLARKIVESYALNMTEKYSMLDEKEIKGLLKRLEGRFIEKIEPIIGNINSNMDSKLKGIRDNVFS